MTAITQTQVFNRPFTAEAYLTYNDGTDTRYELVNGKLVEMPPESHLNARPGLSLTPSQIFLESAEPRND